MFRAIIADDQMPVLEYLQAKIPWQALGLELYSVCADGEEAWEACQQGKPDVLITDIGMPVMNGIELIEKAKQLNSNLATIILSCHEEFHYAQQAVKLNVNDYILKESMDSKQITNILQSIVTRLKDEREAEKKRTVLQTEINRGLSSLKTNFVHCLLDQPIFNEQYWINQAEGLGIHLHEDKRYIAVLCRPDRYKEIEARFGGSQQTKFVVENALHEAIAIAGHIVIAIDDKSFIILYPYPKTLKINQMEMIKEDVQQVQQMLLHHMKIKCSFFIGDAFQTIGACKQQISSLLNNSIQRFYSSELSVLKYSPLAVSTEELFSHYTEALHDIRTALQSGQLKQLDTVLRKWTDHIENKIYPIDMVRSWVLKIVTDVELKYVAMQQFLTNFSVEVLQQKIYAIDTFEVLEEWFNQYLTQKMIHLQQSNFAGIRKDVAEAQRFIMTHLHEKISMDEMAKRLNLNATHFSRTFKKETGETFVEFVTKRKMEKAKELLDHSNQTIEQIALELAYVSNSYFNRVFRSYTGMSPNEYRNKM